MPLRVGNRLLDAGVPLPHLLRGQRVDAFRALGLELEHDVNASAEVLGGGPSERRDRLLLRRLGGEHAAGLEAHDQLPGRTSSGAECSKIAASSGRL
ncbi:MAG: hypothetical protein U0263_40660 [Polyangiaceae bacterium]